MGVGVKAGVGEGSDVGEQLIETKAKIAASIRRFIQSYSPQEE